MPNLNSKYKILPHLKLIIEYHKGILDIESIINFRKKITHDPLFNPDLNFFVHLKNIEFDTVQADVETFVNFIKDNIDVLGKRSVAIITSTPNQVVITTKYKLLQENLNQSVEIFSTYETALDWLNVKLSSKEIEDILTELKN